MAQSRPTRLAGQQIVDLEAEGEPRPERAATGYGPAKAGPALDFAADCRRAGEWLKGGALARMVEEHRARLTATLPDRLDWIARCYDYKTTELIAARRRTNEEAQRGSPIPLPPVIIERAARTRPELGNSARRPYRGGAA